VAASYRIEEYTAATTYPDNPYPVDSQEETDWDEGFSDGTYNITHDF
jgi:hypothetical protein